MKHSGILTVFKKELKRFFGDRRTLISILLPGLLIYLIYSVMGSALGDMFSEEEIVPQISAVNLPASLQPLVDGILKHEFDREGIEFFRTQKLLIEANEEVSWTLDGEYAKGDGPINIENIHSAITFIVP